MSDPQPTPQSSSTSALPNASTPPVADAPAALPHGNSFFANPRVANITGWATSIFLHLVLIIIGFLLLTDVTKLSGLDTTQEQNIIPTSDLAEDTPGGIPNPGMNNDASRAVAQLQDSTVTQSDSWTERKSENLSQTLNTNVDGDASSAPVGMVKTTGLAAQGGNNLAKFGVPGGGQGIGPKGAVFGNGGNAYKIVFVVDSTGSLADRWPVVTRELLMTVGKLKPVQKFNVMLFRDNGFQALDKSMLLDAVQPNRAKLEEFLKKYGPYASASPLAAIEEACKLRPDLIYLLVDPRILDDLANRNGITRDSLAQGIRAARGSLNCKLNIIMFHTRRESTELETIKKDAEFFEKLAKEMGGSFTNTSMDQIYSQ